MRRYLTLSLIALTLLAVILPMQNCSHSADTPATFNAKNLSSIIAQVSAGGLNFTEGSTVTFDVKIAFEPENPIVISAQSENTGLLTISPATLTFDSSNWNVPQTVTVVSLQDDDAADNPVRVTLAAPDVGELPLTLNIVDDETLNLVVSTSALQIIEEDSDHVGVRLSAQPLENVTVQIASSDSNTLVSPASLTFTTQNWNNPVRVDLTAQIDGAWQNRSAAIEFSPSGGLSPYTTNVSIIDVEAPQELVFGPPSVGQCYFFMVCRLPVRLKRPMSHSEPAMDLTLLIEPGTPISLMLMDFHLTLTRENWAQPAIVELFPMGLTNNVGLTYISFIPQLGILHYPWKMDVEVSVSPPPPPPPPPTPTPIPPINVPNPPPNTPPSPTPTPPTI